MGFIDELNLDYTISQKSTWQEILKTDIMVNFYKIEIKVLCLDI